MTIKPIFEIGQTVYIITDPDQYARIVTGYTVRKNGQIFYLVSFVNKESQFEEYELTTEKTYR